MSGGKFNYLDLRLKSDIFNYGDKCSNQFEDLEISELVWDLLDLIHDYDWYASGDTDEETWLKAKSQFKGKWLKNDGSDRIKSIIDKSIENTRSELYKTFNIKHTT